MLCTYSNPQKKEKQHPMKIVCIHVCEDVALDFPFHSILYHIAISSNDHIMNCEFDTWAWIKLAMKYHIHGPMGGLFTFASQAFWCENQGIPWVTRSPFALREALVQKPSERILSHESMKIGRPGLGGKKLPRCFHAYVWMLYKPYDLFTVYLNMFVYVNKWNM